MAVLRNTPEDGLFRPCEETQALRQRLDTAWQLDAEAVARFAGIGPAVARPVGGRRVVTTCEGRDPSRRAAQPGREPHDLAGEVAPGGALGAGEMKDAAASGIVRRIEQ